MKECDPRWVDNPVGVTRRLVARIKDQFVIDANAEVHGRNLRRFGDPVPPRSSVTR
jgi:hypothetical protein